MTDIDLISRRRPDGVEDRPMGWWGTVLLGMVLATTYGALCFTYVYVRVATFAWPPADLAPPALGLPALSVTALVVSCVPLVAAGVRPERSLARHRAAMVIAVMLATVHGGLLLADWRGQPFAVDDHVYASLYYVLPGIHLFLVGVGVVFALTVLALSWHTEVGQHRVGERSLRVYWAVVVAGGALLLAVVYLTPHVWREALPA